MTGENKRFETRKSILDENGYFIADKKGKYVFPIFHSLEDTRAYMFCKALNELAEENDGLQKAKIKYQEENKHLKNIISELEEERDYYQTKCASLEEGLFKADRENNMLKNTIGRNESYINRLKHKGLWSNKSKED